MANIKNLKKDLNYLTNELLTECFTFQFFHVDIDPKLVNDVAATIINNRNELVGRINHVENKNEPKLVKEHFRKIRTDFDKSVEAVGKLKKKK